jgi:hypothetical protein
MLTILAAITYPWAPALSTTVHSVSAASLVAARSCSDTVLQMSDSNALMSEGGCAMGGAGGAGRRPGSRDAILDQSTVARRLLLSSVQNVNQACTGGETTTFISSLKRQKGRKRLNTRRKCEARTRACQCAHHQGSKME